ncbi:SDR family oxidoreductase [Ramlibacter sp. 2FC]|uniref:SDR family NAD(P)-dependent oxidoreductase n=1 Tax=Ramlibacter sp. 2FC TaxID=2502188 RepID=UPI0024C26E01|nr:SDR family oxidoreductase [Ramlibacter sp. 2FC]
MFAKEGASLALLDLDQQGVAETARLVDGYGLQADVSSEGSTSVAVEAAAKALSGIDGLVNAAGIMRSSPMVETSASAWRRAVEVNLTGPHIVARCCLPWLLKEPHATIVNVASAAGLLLNAPGLTAYSASKGGLRQPDACDGRGTGTRRSREQRLPWHGGHADGGWLPGQCRKLRAQAAGQAR